MPRDPIILLYHRVIDLPCDPQLLCVAPQHFAEQMSVVRETCYPMSLADLLEARAGDRLARRTVAVTFDDGYADNLDQAGPRLAHCDVPATVFVTPIDCDDPREFWWDELQCLLLTNAALPASLTITIGGEQFAWDLPPAQAGTGIGDRGPVKWSVLHTGGDSPREAAYRRLCETLRPLGATERDDALERLSAWAGVPRTIRVSHQRLLPDQIRRLATAGPVEIGAHTVTHPVLAAMASDGQHAEIAGGKARLEQIVERPVTSFSYPYGTRSDYTAETVAIVRASGFGRACANVTGTVGANVDTYQLPRFVVRDWSGDRFAEQLDAWFDD